jgi:hypothetical protein
MQKGLDTLGFIFDRPKLSLVFGVLLVVMGVLLSDVPRMIISQGWPSTTGTITSHRFLGQKFEEYDGDFYTKVDVYIHYQYSVNGVKYISQTINAINSLFYPADYADRYPVDSEVIVYYNPRNPYDAVLEPGFVGPLLGLDVINFSLFGLGIYFCSRGISKIREKRLRLNNIGQ